MGQMASVFCLLSFFSSSFFIYFYFFYCYDLVNFFKIMFLSLYSDNLIILEFRDVWDKDCCICSRRVCSCERREKRGIYVKVLWQHFFLRIFLPVWEDKKSGPRRENFFPCFLSLIFSFPNQTMENNIFHPIFLSLFSILPIFTPTKHILNLRF